MEKLNKQFKNSLILVAFGVVLYVALQNVTVVAGAAWKVANLFSPLAVGGAIAFILNVPMSFFERKLEGGLKGKMAKAKTPLAMLITVLLFILVIAIIGYVIFPNLAKSIKELVVGVASMYPVWIAKLEALGLDTTMVEGLVDKIDFDNIMKELRENANQILSTASAAAGSVLGVVSNIGFGLVFAIYILSSKKKLGEQAKQIVYAYLPKKWADEICYVASLSYNTFAGFMSGQCLEAVILGSMFCVVLLVGGFPDAITIGVIIGAMSLIPFVGAFIGLVFGILMISVAAPGRLIIFIILFFVVQQIEGNLIYPKVVGGSVGLPAIWTLLAVVVGGSVSGIFGIIVFIPIFSVLYALIRRDVHRRLEKKKIAE